MRIPHIITGAALMAAFVIGCSKSPSATPTVHFLGYKVERDGTAYAMTEIRNPSPSQIVCQLEVQPKDARSGIDSTVVPARGSQRFNIYVSQTNETSLDVTFFKVVPTSHTTVPMQ